MISPTKIIIGTANFNRKYGILNNISNYKDVKKILNYSRKKKIKFLETSKDYGQNFNKKIQFKSKNILKDFKLFKKIDLEHNYFSTGNVIKKVMNYLYEKKKYKRCYGVVIRKPNLLLNAKGQKLFNLLINLKKNKNLSKIGITIYDTKNLKRVINNLKIDFIQLPYNFLNYQTFETVKKLIKNRKIEIHLRSIFLQGLLLKQAQQLPSELKQIRKYWSYIDDYLNSIGMNRYEACLNFATNSGADKFILGIDNVSQLKQVFKTKNFKKKLQRFSIKEKKLIDPVYWLKLKKR